MLLGKDFVMQGGVRNYLGKTEEVNNAPRYWKSSPTSPKTELSYITDAEKQLLLDANLHGSLLGGKPNIGAAGLLSFDGWGDVSGGVSDTSASNAGAEGGQGSGSSGNTGYQGGGGYDYEGAAYGTPDTIESITSSSNNGNNTYVVPDPQLPPGVVSNNFDYETEAYTGTGKIESNFYNDETGEFNIVQTPGVIPAVDYQTSNIGAYLDNPNVSDEAKTDFLGRLKAISNSDLVGTNIDGIEDQFVLDNLDNSLNSIINQTKYSKYTSDIDEVAKTFESDLKNTPLQTISKSGGLLGTFFRGVTDNYKNNKAMDLLGYTGSAIRYNPDGSGDFKYSGNYLMGNVSPSERDAINQLTPLAPYVISNTTPQRSMVNDYFSNLNLGQALSSSLQTSYNNAKTNVNNLLGITPISQQFGYSTQPYGLLSSTNLASNPFNIDYLRTRGLI